MADESSIEALKQAFRRLPGVGPKSAQRMAFHLLSRDRDGAREIARALDRVLTQVRHCDRCNNFTEHALCEICASPKRDASQLCIVESPADLASLEQAGALQGMYFVLMGRLSPLDGVGPEQIGIPKLQARLGDGTVKEVIIATNLTVEGEATAHFIAELARARGLRVSRIAHGVPIGGELEYTDRVTLARALAGRRDA